MQELKQNNKGIHDNEYNSEEVAYCKTCLSLRILVLDENTDYCDECGSTNIEFTDIASWEMMYEQKYNKPFNKL